MNPFGKYQESQNFILSSIWREQNIIHLELEPELFADVKGISSEGFHFQDQIVPECFFALYVHWQNLEKGCQRWKLIAGAAPLFAGIAIDVKRLPMVVHFPRPCCHHPVLTFDIASFADQTLSSKKILHYLNHYLHDYHHHHPNNRGSGESCPMM